MRTGRSMEGGRGRMGRRECGVMGGWRRGDSDGMGQKGMEGDLGRGR